MVVFDVAGSVSDVLRAARQVPGLEFLAELDDGYREPDDDFYLEEGGEKSEKPVPETLYLVMSNATAAGQLVSLFQRWLAEPDAAFDRGLAPLKHLFEQLRDLRRWGPEDRVRETGLLQQWAEDVATVGAQGTRRVEIELWFRSDPALRASAEAIVDALVSQAGGVVLQTSEIPAIDYHAVLADLPHTAVVSVLERGPEAIELLKAESVMFVSPFRPMSIPGEVAVPGDPGTLPQLGTRPPVAPPRVALLDGLPLANHAVLAGRLVVDDPDDLAAAYTSGQQRHGTAMASLICHGDLSAPGPALETQLYVRVVLRPHEYFDEDEVAPGDELLVDLIHRSFRRMFDMRGTERPLAPGVRIVNLSLGDPGRVFTRRLSPAARLLDWLALEYNVLIVVSAGNHDCAPEVDVDLLANEAGLRSAVLASGYERARLRGLLAPAESINAIAVGATHEDGSDPELPDTVIDTSAFGMPAGYGAVGLGHRRSVKPDVLMPGGRQLHVRPGPTVTDVAVLRPARQSRVGPGLLVAAPDVFGGPTGTAYTVGTSNAAALATRAAAQILDRLVDHVDGPDEFPFPDPQYHPVLTKALLVHAARWGSLRDRLRRELGVDPVRFRREVTRLLGYGPVDVGRLATATSHRVVLIGAGSAYDGMRQTHAFPLPPSLGATTDWRRLTVTLAWISPTNPRSIRHRMARLWYDTHETLLGVDREEGDYHAVRAGTVQHEVFEGRRVIPFVSGATLELDVDCRIDAGRWDRGVRYAIVASIEVEETLRADIQAEVRDAIRAQVRARVAQRTRG